MTQLTEAFQILRNIGTEFEEVRIRLRKHEAICCGLSLEEHAAKWPVIEGYYYTCESEYDDQGGYYDNVNIRPVVEDDSTNEYQELIATNGYPEEDYDSLDVWSKDACEELFSYTEETVSVDDIRKRVLELSKGAFGSDPNS